MTARSRTDHRIALGLLLFALLYALEARTFEAGVLVDPVGPRAFPLLLAAILALVGCILLARPTNDRPRWPGAPAWRQMALLCLSLVGYGYLIQPLGYLLSTTAVLVVLSLLFGGSALKSTAAAVALVAGLYLVFSTLLGLYLPALPAS